MKILVTGKNGQLGKSIQKIVDGKNKQKFKSYDFVFIGRNELDFFNISDINYFFDNNYFDVVINCAAYTQVDQAESDEKKANLINHIAVKEIAKISKKNNMNLIHISTDFVFDGLNKRPYCENDKTLPLNVYGKTKLAGERAILSIMEFNAIILLSVVPVAKIIPFFVAAIPPLLNVPILNSFPSLTIFPNGTLQSIEPVSRSYATISP